MRLHRIFSACTMLLTAAAAFAQPEHGHMHGGHHPPPETPASTAPTPPMEHRHHGEGHDQHGMVAPESRDFPTLAYDDTRTARAPQTMTPPAMPGNAHVGKQLAYSPNKGRCLSCHVLGADGEQPGTVGPNLSDYAQRGIAPAQTFEQIWDARVRNPHSVMPAFGTFNLLSADEVAHVTAFLHTLNTPVAAPAPPPREPRAVWVAGEDLTLADAYLGEGEALFTQPGPNGKSCASCHASSDAAPDLKSAAATFPKWDAQRKRIVLLEQRINFCRMQYMSAGHFPPGSRESNLLTSYVKYLARRTPLDVATDGPAGDAVARGKASFYRRVGQLNFSCATCHAPEQPVAGQWMRGDVTHPMAKGDADRGVAGQWPKHFIGGHDLGLLSLQQRIQHCQAVTRVFPLQPGATEYVELELYLTSLGNGMPMLAPTLSRLRGE
jgi:sulfur-oxidizing protein SoxA